MKLKCHIENEHNGNVSAFAKSQGVLQSQVYRWFKRDCEWHNGHIWCKITKQVTNGRDIKP